LRARLKSAARDVPIAELDRRVRPSGPDASDGDDGLPGRALKYHEIEPWDELVDGAQLLTEIATAIESYIVMGAHQRDAAALWVVFAHAQDFFVYAPLLIVLSPIRRCGKTKLQEMLARLSPRPQSMSGITAAALARLVEKDRPTVFIDEFDAIANGNRELSESLRGQLNSSFNKSSAHILKSVPLPGVGWEVRRFSTWAPTCVAGIGQVPNTVADRSVIIRLTRKLGMQSVRRLSARDGGELHLLARKIARFVADNEHRLRRDEPDVPNELNDRARDAWEPLITIADIAGGEWPERARRAKIEFRHQLSGEASATRNTAQFHLQVDHIRTRQTNWARSGELYGEEESRTRSAGAGGCELSGARGLNPKQTSLYRRWPRLS
jgi:putative DNA primase/helicase